MSGIGELELSVLLTVAKLADEAYGASERREVSSLANRDYSVGCIYTTLQRLEDKGLVTSAMSEPTAIRGGRAKRCFRITALGERTARAAHQARTALWKGVPSRLRAT